MATAYGGVNPGNHWCTFTLTAATVARPDTGSGATSVLRQRKHAGAGGWNSRWHAWQRWMSSSSFAPPCQNDRDSHVGSGSTRESGRECGTIVT